MDAGRLATRQVPAKERERASRPRHSGSRLHEVDVRIGMSRQQVGVRHSTGETFVKNLDIVLAVSRQDDIGHGIVTHLPASE